VIERSAEWRARTGYHPGPGGAGGPGHGQFFVF
jgi:hypothetical protein